MAKGTFWSGFVGISTKRTVRGSAEATVATARPETAVFVG
jgi:hypothetical protein